jgi:AraC-like DNA-binding protein
LAGDSPVENILSMLQTEVRGFFPSNGSNTAAFSGMALYRFHGGRIDMPQSENPYLYIVIDGALRLYTPSGIMDYMAGQYSVSKIDTPLYGTILSLSKNKDFIAISLDIAVNDVIGSILDLDNELTERIVKETISEQEKDFADHAVTESVYRLVSATKQPLVSNYICRNIKREIIYYVLCGSYGKQFLQSITNMQEVDKIYEANTWIKENFHRPFTVESLAERQNMSVSLFHQKFKSAVGMGPLQCQKRLRLTEARRLMIDENRNVTEASLDVGYESLSQFTRDYRKMFGASPKEDILRLKNQIEKQANF